MLSNLVSIADTLAAQAWFAVAAMVWTNPLAALVLIGSMMGLAVILWLEVSSRRPRKSRLAEVVRPMRLR